MDREKTQGAEVNVDPVIWAQTTTAREYEGTQQERGRTPRVANAPLCLEFRTGWQWLGDSRWSGGGSQGERVTRVTDGPGSVAVKRTGQPSCEPSAALPSVRLQWKLQGGGFTSPLTRWSYADRQAHTDNNTRGPYVPARTFTDYIDTLAFNYLYYMSKIRT